MENTDFLFSTEYTSHHKTFRVEGLDIMTLHAMRLFNRYRFYTDTRVFLWWCTVFKDDVQYFMIMYNVWW